MLTKRYDIQDIATLKARFGYMFAGPAIDFVFCKGWFPIVVGLCVEVDRVLGAQRARFQWVRIKEKFGVMRLHFHLQGAPEPLWDALWNALQGLVSQAGHESARCCMVCGAPGSLSHTSAWRVTVCERHSPDNVSSQGGLSLRALMQVPERGEASP